MKVNPLLNDLFRGVWLLDVNWVSGAAPLVDRLLEGKTLNLPQSTMSDEASGIITIVDENGSALKKDSEGRLMVPEGSIAVVSMIGAIIKYGDFCTYGADEIVDALQKADNNPNIKAIIFKLDGPGGAVSAIGPFQQFAANKKTPVIGLADACMSLHYWAAVQVCDYLMADNDVSARFGSVGVVSSFVDAQPYWEEKGYKFHEIYPEESKHKNEAFRLALEEKYDMIKSEHLSPIAKKFQNAVRTNMPGLKEEEGVLTGKTFDADASLGLGMIHAIGGFKQAIEMANIYSEIKSMNSNQ